MYQKSFYLNDHANNLGFHDAVIDSTPGTGGYPVILPLHPRIVPDISHVSVYTRSDARTPIYTNVTQC